MKVLDKHPIELDGRYLITDPCYVYGDYDGGGWDEFCTLLWANKDDIVLFEIDGKEIPVMSTRWGDGCYPVILDGHEVGSFGVDAGLFAFIPTTAESDNRGPIVELKGRLTYENGDAIVDDKLVVDTSGDSNDEEEAWD